MIYEVVRAHPITGIDEIIKAATIIEKLKSFGTEKPEGSNEVFKAMKLKTVPTDIELEDDHFNYVKNAFNKTPMSSSVKIELLAQTAKLLKSVD